MVMEVTIRLNDVDIERARALTGIEDVADLVPFVLRRYSQLEAGARLARMGGSDPSFEIPPRRRPDDPID